eukprot:GFYU01006315.1.p1 GENE.GFYU01006315.1~~GFYU01006315.1.p1  ORF type:complete len:266 (-),score=50.62 GFYU01006315.1:238-1035(-)
MNKPAMFEFGRNYAIKHTDVTSDVDTIAGATSMQLLRGIRDHSGPTCKRHQHRYNTVNKNVTTKRFPAIQQMDEDVQVIILPKPPKLDVTDKSQLLKVRSMYDNPSNKKPGPLSEIRKKLIHGQHQRRFDGVSPTKKRSPVKQRPPFSPCNPHAAKTALTENRFVSVGTPYDAPMRQVLAQKQEDQAKMCGPVFRPNAPAQAKEQLSVDYFLNSPDTRTKEAERNYVRERARQNLVDYKEKLKSVRDTYSAVSSPRTPRSRGGRS